MIEWIRNNYIEVIGAFFALIYLILEIRQKWTMWIIGFISSSFYIYIFFHSKLYAETDLNIYYAIMAVYGLYCWKFAKASGKEELQVKHINKKASFVLGSLAIILFAIMSATLVYFTDSPVPYADSLVASLSIIATWMVAKKIIEHWYVWIFTNFFSVGLYIYQNLHATAVLYIIYGSMSIVGLMEWKKSVKDEKLKTTS